MEEAAFRSFVRADARIPTDFDDPLFARCADALREFSEVSGASSLDVAVLIRQVIRRFSERDEAPYELQISEELTNARTDWEAVGISPLTAGSSVLLRATPFRPDWLADLSGPVDACAVAG